MAATIDNTVLDRQERKALCHGENPGNNIVRLQTDEFGNLKTKQSTTVNGEDKELSVQYPLPVDGDSIYCKDIDQERSILNGWTGSVCDLFDDLYTEVENTSSDNPKTLTVAFRRSTPFSSFGFGCGSGASFSNIRVVGIASGGAEFPIFDESSDDAKRTTKVIQLNSTVAVTKLRLEFYTADPVCLTNIFILKLREIIVNSANESSPIHVNDTDHNKRTALNSVFGDRLVGQRVPSIAAQFQYGLASDDADYTVVGTGSIALENSLLKVSTGTDSNGAVNIQSTTYLRYIPGHEAYCYFTGVFAQGIANSYQYVGLFDENDGFYLGFNGVDFVIGRRREGVDYQDIIDTTKVLPFEQFDPTKGNVYAITFGYLGFATINYSVLDSSGVWRNIGRIEYPNTSTETHIKQTNLPVRAEIVNTGNTTDIQFSSGSLTAGIVDGAGADPGKRSFTWSGPITTVSGGNNVVVVFRSKSTYNAIENRISSRLALISSATDVSKIPRWRLLKNPPITGGTWTDVSVDSVLEYSTDTTVTDFTGESFIDWSMGKSDAFFEDVLDYNMLLPPNGVAAFVVELPGGTNGEVNLAIRWDELF